MIDGERVLKEFWLAEPSLAPRVAQFLDLAGSYLGEDGNPWDEAQIRFLLLDIYPRKVFIDNDPIELIPL